MAPIFWTSSTAFNLKPIAFKVRGGGNYSGTKGGAVRPNEKGGAGYLGYEDKTFTISTAPDQWILAPMKPIISPTITTCKGSRGGCSDEAIEEIKAVQAAREQQHLLNQPITNPMNEPAQPTPVGKPSRYLSVCSGMEAASVAWHPLGWQPVGFSEIEPFPCAILKHRFPNTPNYGSLTEYKQWPIEPGAIDLLVGGTPCQSFSVAGLRKGLEDPRGNLALVFLGLADKLKPRWIVWENVPGVLSSGGGRDFGSFLGAWVELGYGFAYRVLDAQHFGVPQRRRRVFVVACLGDWRAPAEVLLESDCVRRDIKKGRAKGQGVASSVEGGVGANHPEGCWWDGGQVSQTLDAVLQKGQTMPEKNRFPAVLQPIAMRESGQGFWMEDDKAGTLRAEGENRPSRPSHVIGRPIPYRKSKRACSTTDNETWVEADAANTLNNFDLGDTRTTHAVVEPHIVQASELRLRGQITEQDTVPTLLANTKSGDNDPLAVHPVAFQPGNLMRKAGADPSTETFPTLTKDSGDQSPHVAYPCVPLDGMNLLSRLGLCGEEHSMQNFEHGDPSFTLRKGGVQHGVLTPMAVRRLTPVECERLQGFPDNWSRISWKGKPEEQCPDGPRYKACGNSMAIPVMRWIGERIAAVDAKL